MAPIAKEPDALNSGHPGTEPAALAGAKPQPAAAEIPVTVNGARTVEGTDKREPFSENTQTVLVLPKGAVIRLSSAVAPGQLLFLTNEKTKKEVVCQVVKSKNHNSASGYVELEFTEAAPGFWGLRFGGSLPAASAPGVAKPAASIPAPAKKSLEEKLAEVTARTSAKAPAPPAANSSISRETKPAAAPEPPQQVAAISATDAKELKAAPTVPAQPPATASKLPTLSEFLTHGASGPELKSSERAKTDGGEKKAEAGAQEVKKQNAGIAESSKPAAQTGRRESLTNLLVPAAAKENPAPGASTFDFGSEEIKIPAWLEPLARNSASSPAVQETKAPVVMDADARPLEPKVSEGKAPEGAASRFESTEQIAPEPFSVGSASEEPAKQGAEFAFSSEGSTPNFGSSLEFGAKSAHSETGTQGPGKALTLGLLAAGLLLAAGGGWYWYSNQPKDVSANGAVSSRNNFESPAALSSASAPPEPVPVKPSLASSADTNRNPVSPQTVRAEGKGIVPTGTGVSRQTTTASTFEPPVTPAEQPAAEPAKKPSLGNLRLAAPKVNRRPSAAENIAPEGEPALTSAGVTGVDPSNLNMLASKGKQPAAPAPVGGDVRPARLISSVAPVYPQLARNQRLSGNVVVDALIDVNGRVSTMKVVSGPALLHQSAMDSLRQWKYEPATLNGQPMAMHLTVTVRFKLQ